MGIPVNHKVTGLDGRRGPLRGAAQVSADAGQEFLNAEGLGDVIVSAGVQRLDLGALMVADRKDEDRGCSLGADGAGDLDS